jgi:hypothetical protein
MKRSPSFNAAYALNGEWVRLVRVRVRGLGLGLL